MSRMRFKLLESYLPLEEMMQILRYELPDKYTGPLDESRDPKLGKTRQQIRRSLAGMRMKVPGDAAIEASLKSMWDKGSLLAYDLHGQQLSHWGDCKSPATTFVLLPGTDINKLGGDIKADQIMTSTLGGK